MNDYDVDNRKNYKISLKKIQKQYIDVQEELHQMRIKKVKAENDGKEAIDKANILEKDHRRIKAELEQLKLDFEAKLKSEVFKAETKFREEKKSLEKNQILIIKHYLIYKKKLNLLNVH